MKEKECFIDQYAINRYYLEAIHRLREYMQINMILGGIPFECHLKKNKYVDLNFFAWD